ncbi:hypothetical protein H5410_062361 [Solanum commersonii]|uniref:Uncharacterized protein n=1 Tax=Solanum commersonii TaxID=4109 RepID=A0A9J5WA63_SOLCO|nr:hypothetical protein H5410_062361 [Solanum commersonii]
MQHQQDHGRKLATLSGRMHTLAGKPDDLDVSCQANKGVKLNGPETPAPTTANALKDFNPADPKPSESCFETNNKTNYVIWGIALTIQELSCSEDESHGYEDVKVICGHTMRNKIRNEDIPDKVGVTSMVDKIRKSRLR